MRAAGLALVAVCALALAACEADAVPQRDGARVHAPSGRQLGMRLDAAEGRTAITAVDRHAPDGRVCNMVSRVVDGDTLRLRNGEKVRLIGVDTPETKHPLKPVEPLGPEASAFTKREIEHRLVRLERNHEARDRYGRLLAYVYRKPDGMFLNAALIRAGLSPAYTRYRFRMRDDFVALEAAARREGLGLWRGSQSPEPLETTPAPAPSAQPPAPAVTRAPDEDCRIKGNIGSDGERIYHTPDSPWYARTRIDESQGERWFCTETEARAAGWRPPRE